MNTLMQKLMTQDSLPMLFAFSPLILFLGVLKSSHVLGISLDADEELLRWCCSRVFSLMRSVMVMVVEGCTLERSVVVAPVVLVVVLGGGNFSGPFRHGRRPPGV
jgi:hypothetical protein